MDSPASEPKRGAAHVYCCLYPILSGILWIVGVFSLVMAWRADGVGVWGWGPEQWYWNALVAGILALPGLKKPGSCRSAGSCCDGGSCGMCKK